MTGVSVGGLGHHDALELARRGARVVLAGRNPERLAETARRSAPRCPTRPSSSSRSTSPTWRRCAPPPVPPPRSARSTCWSTTPGSWRRRTPVTADGLEMQLGDQPLRAVPADRPAAAAAVARTPGWSRCRRTCTASPSARRSVTRRRITAATAVARLRPDQAGQPAVHLRARPAAARVRAVALGAGRAPGFAGTHLVANGQFGRSAGGIATILDRRNRLVSQPAALGAWPMLMAATADLPGATYCGPSGLGESAGPPQLVGWSRLAGSRSAQRELWELSERVTGISYP